MAKFTHDVIIIGGGAAGLTAASGCAQLGLKTALIDIERLGGDCLYYGCVPSKTLLKSAHIRKYMEEADNFGLPKPSLSPVDMEKVNARVAEVIKSIAWHDSPERFTQLGAEVIFDRPRFISDREVLLEGGKIISSSGIIIATGSSPRIPQIPGISETGYITNKEIFSMKKLPPRLLVIGGGPIGIELGQALSRLGSKVTILNSGSRILSKEDPDISEIISRKLVQEGIKIFNNAAVKKAESRDDIKIINFTVDGKNMTAEGEEILISAGRTGNHNSLEVEKAGIETEKGFIKVNSFLETTAKGIMTIGDANGRYMFTHIAGAEGSLAVRKTVFHIPVRMDYSAVPWCTYTDPEIASVGYNEIRAAEAGLKYKVIETPMNDLDRAQAEGSVDGKIKILLDRKDRVLGTQIAGVSAGELLGPSILAVKKRYKMMELTSPVIPYPTLGEIHKKAGGKYYSPKLFNPRIRKILKLLFRYRG